MEDTFDPEDQQHLVRSTLILRTLLTLNTWLE